MKKRILRFFLLICIFSFMLSGCEAVSDLLEDAGLKESSVKSRDKDDEDNNDEDKRNGSGLNTPVPYENEDTTPKPEITDSLKPVVTATPEPTKSRDERLYEEACSLIENFENRYYISKLKGDELEDLLALYQSYLDCESDCKLPCPIDSDQLHVLMVYLNYECPELVMYSSDDYTFYYLDSTKTLIKSIELPILCDKATAENYLAAVNAKIDTLLQKTEGMTDYQKELYFYEYLINNNSYVLDSRNCASPYGVLIEGKGRCEGIAKTMKLCMERCGIDCVCIRGLKSGIAFGAHVWNSVKINGKYYDIDVTMDDIDKNSDGTIGQFPVPYGLVNVSSTFERSRYEIDAANLRYGIPGTDSMEMSYHYLNGTQVENSTEGIELLQKQLDDIYASEEKSGVAMVQIIDSSESEKTKENIESVIKKWLKNNRVNTYNYQWYYYSDGDVVLIEISF